MSEKIDETEFDSESEADSNKDGNESDNSEDDYEMMSDDDEIDIQDTFGSDDDDDDDDDEKEIGVNQNIDFSEDEDEDEDDDDAASDDENYLQKFKESLKTNVISEHHPELIVQNFEEVNALCTIVRDQDGVIVDPLHRTLPFITKYEKAKVLGERAKQLNSGAEPFVEVGHEIIDGYLIALAEFEQKKIPMIIRRPLPNGGSEFWRLVDLEVL
jgi:DNA-directed RNA polymerase I, II, and III subunit RPABC2